MPELDNPGLTAADEVAVSTPEPIDSADTAAEEVETDVETTDDAAESDDTTESAEPAESETESDPFADLTVRFPTEEEIKKLRIPKEVKTEISRISKIAQETTQKLEELGGDLAADALKPLGKALLKTNVSDDDLGEIIGALGNANPALALQLIAGSAQSVLSDPHQADVFLTNEFGSAKATKANINQLVDLMDEYEADPSKISELLKLDKAGLLDTEYAREQFQTDFAATNLYQQMQSKQEEYEKKVAELSAIINDPAKLEAIRSQGKPDSSRQFGEFTSDFDKEIGKRVEKIVSRVKWGNESKLTELVTKVIKAELQSDKQYSDVAGFIKDHGVYRQGDNVLPMIGANLHLLGNRAEAMAIDFVKGIQSDYKRILTETSRNAKLAKESEQDEAETVKEAKLDTGKPMSAAERQEMLRQQFVQRMRAQRQAAAQGSQV